MPDSDREEPRRALLAAAAETLLSDELRTLLARAEVEGSLGRGELVRVIEAQELDSRQVVALYGLLDRRGIDVVAAREQVLRRRGRAPTRRRWARCSSSCARSGAIRF